eukprot:UN07968
MTQENETKNQYNAVYAEGEKITVGFGEEYCEKLISNGFDTVHYISQATVEDLHLIGIKIGHTRRIYDYFNDHQKSASLQSSDQPQPIPTPDAKDDSHRKKSGSPFLYFPQFEEYDENQKQQEIGDYSGKRGCRFWIQLSLQPFFHIMFSLVAIPWLTTIALLIACIGTGVYETHYHHEWLIVVCITDGIALISILVVLCKRNPEDVFCVGISAKIFMSCCLELSIKLQNHDERISHPKYLFRRYIPPRVD